MQLRFYSYFKQATEGKCHQKRPGIWNPVARWVSMIDEMKKLSITLFPNLRAKWEAWTRLGNMPREEAMNSYVEELKKVK